MSMVKNIIPVVSQAFQIEETVIGYRTNTRSIVLPRQVCFYVHHKITGDTLRQAAKDLDLNYDAKTVSHGIKTVERLIGVYPDLKEKVNNILKILTAA